MKLILASSRGFCAGVQRAVSVVEKCLEKFSVPVYVNHEIVHNKFVVENFQKKGVVFCDDLEKIPKGSVLIISAHGVSTEFKKQANKKGLKLIDATCPLVSSVHFLAEKLVKNNYHIFYIGQKNHQEAMGFNDIKNLTLITTVSEAEKINYSNFNNQLVAILTQTTLSKNETTEIITVLKEKFPLIQVNNNICYATQNRQNAITEIAQKADGVIIIGSKNSSNSNKLVSVAQKYCSSVLCENALEIPNNFLNMETIGISSGASVPEILLDEVISFFKERKPDLSVENLLKLEENISFTLPFDVLNN